MRIDAMVRRDATAFLLVAILPALAVSALFALHPWPTAHPSQAALLGFAQTAPYLAIGLLGAVLARRVGCSRRETPAWRIAAWAVAAGILAGAFDLGLGLFTPWGAKLEAIDHANGYTWANVALPWSLAHYLHASILMECAFRLFAIVVPTWLIGRLLLKGRFEATVFWTFAVLAAWIEPLMKAVMVRKLPLAGLTPLETLVNLTAVAEQLAFAWVLRRFGWSAPILMRFGYYLLVRVFAGYLYPPDSVMYPGPH
jgi:hypothetical protein